MSTIFVHSSAILGLATDADPIMVPDDQFDTLDAALVDELAEGAVNL